MAYESEVVQHELEDEYSGEGEWEMEDEYEDESSLEGEGWLGAIGNVVGSLLGESEDERGRFSKALGGLLAKIGLGDQKNCPPGTAICNALAAQIDC